MNGCTPLQITQMYGYDPDNTYVIFNKEGVNVALAGINPHDDMTAQIWMIATDDLEKHGIEFLRNCRAFVKEITLGYGLLYNWVMEENEVHVKWLKWLGFTFIKRHPTFGAAGVPFLTFVRINQCA